MNDLPDGKLPDLSDAVLGANEVAALFRDYQACVEIDEIIIKAAPGFVQDGVSPSLAEAEALLQSRQVRGVQIRYRYDGWCWWDTLMSRADGFRLVRIKHPLET